MKLQPEVVLACTIVCFCIQQVLCDELSATSGLNNWTCICSAPYQGNQSYVRSNCSTSCNCNPAGAPSDDTWTCICVADGFPKVAADSNDSTCFTACNCTSGTVTSPPRASRNHISGKVVVIILLLCVVFTTLAFLAAVTCYFLRKEKCPIQSPIFSSDRETSFNSSTNLISHETSLALKKNLSIDFPINPVSGCFGKSSFLCRSKTEIIYGTIVRFSYTQLENATDKFSHCNLIGLGANSSVYRGQLRDDRIVAVKRLKDQGGPDADSLFSKEVELLSRLHHCHVVPLLGYCSESLGTCCERLLVFEYMPNGNLRDYLDGKLGGNIDWETRVRIAMGAARGLEYLHEAAAPRILHRDVKSTNILLDENWNSKITDLGMAQCLRADGVPSSSGSPARMQGTFGYFAPEYAMVGRASLMSDVFSFGVVLLELITGRQPIHKLTNKGEESLVLWATPHLHDSSRVTSELPDPRLKGKFPEGEMQIMAYLAKECLLLDPDARPTMSEVVQILSTISADKSRRRNAPINLFQISVPFSEKTGPHVIRADSKVEDIIDADEPRQNTSIREKVQYSLPSDIEHTVLVGSKAREVDTVSTECMEKLILLTSRAQSWPDLDDEAMDLTEPRLESFRMSNVNSP